MNIRYSIILPAYNESRALPTALEAIREVFDALGEEYEIIVVDDGSNDGTSAASLRTPNVVLVCHPENRGKGAAIKSGTAAASGEILLFLDCDLSVHPESFLSFLPLLEKYDLVLGSRRVPGAHIALPQPWYRMRLGQIFNWLVRRRTGLPFHDTQCGFKAFKASAKGIVMDLKTNGWTFDVELLLKIKQAGYSIAEVPVEWRNGRETRVKIRDAWKIWKELCKLSE